MYKSFAVLEVVGRNTLDPPPHLITKNVSFSAEENVEMYNYSPVCAVIIFLLISAGDNPFSCFSSDLQPIRSEL